MPPERSIGVDLSNAWVTDADLAKLARLPQLESINLAYTKITDQGLEHLAPLENVKVLDLYYAESVTDLGIAHLKHWKNLEHLNVRGTKVTSTLFEHIASMTKLRFLDVGHSRVNDDLFELLESLDHLEHLSFGGNKMSGAALPLAEVVARAQGVERLRPAADRLRPLERLRDRLQHRPHRATSPSWKSSTWARPTSRIGASRSWRA